MKITSLLLPILASLLLTACVGGSDSSRTESNVAQSQTRVQAPVTNSTPSNYTAPTTTSTSNSNPAPANYTAPPSSNLLRLPIHYSLLLGQPFVWNEAGGVKNLSLSQYASAGASTINLDSTAGLVQQQLITYRGRNSQYYTAQIQSIQSNSLRLTTPLQQDIYVGSNAWNFYDNGSHPNWAGFNAIADFSIDQLGWNRLNQGKHVLFGDSWFSRNTVIERLRSRLPGASFSNKGVGGETSWNLLARFDADVSWQNPNFVWILTGTNDYWQDVSASDYKSNIRQLINRVKSLGAVPIVFDSSVGPLNFGSDWKTRLSRSYVVSLEQLVSEN